VTRLSFTRVLAPCVATAFVTLLIAGCAVAHPATTPMSPTARSSSTATRSVAPTPAPTSSGGASTVAFGTLAAGDCLVGTDGSDQEKPATAQLVPCGTPHTAEVFAFPALGGGAFPGDESTMADADELCADAFATYVGVSIYDTTLNPSAFTPGQSAWNAGDHNATCIVFDASGDLVGSVKGLGAGTPTVVAP
jgi:hypothetical protein